MGDGRHHAAGARRHGKRDLNFRCRSLAAEACSRCGTDYSGGGGSRLCCKQRVFLDSPHWSCGVLLGAEEELTGEPEPAADTVSSRVLGWRRNNSCLA